MSNRLTSTGYVKRTPEQIKTELVEKLKQKQSSFFEQAADIQNMLLDTSILGIMEYENLCAEMINAYSPFFQNEFMFMQMASSLGLKQKSEFKSQVMLEFSGDEGDYIPAGVNVQGFITQESIILPSTKKAFVLALSEKTDIAPSNSLTQISEILKEGISVTNPSPSYAKVEEETFEQLKERAQAYLRSPRISSSEYARSNLLKLDGVAPRLVSFKIREIIQNINEKDVLVQGIECICGGGKPNEVANILFNSFFETQKLISSPSDNDDSRCVRVDVNYYGATIPISYTTPKLLNLKLKINIAFQQIVVPPNTVEKNIEKGLVSYINNKIVGEPLNELTLRNIIINQLKDSFIPSEEIKTLIITPQINDVDKVWGANGYLAEVQFDCYLILNGLIVTIAAGRRGAN